LFISVLALLETYLIGQRSLEGSNSFARARVQRQKMSAGLLSWVPDVHTDNTSLP